jgi:hypothetical protein
MERPKRRTLTSPGLGDSGLRPKQEAPSVPPRSLASGAREHEDEVAADSLPRSDTAPPFSGEVPVDRAEKISTRRPRTSRPPVRVDDVGDVAVAIASKAKRSATAPRLLKTRRELADAPIDHRDAFVISLIDGKTPTQALVDVSGLPEPDVMRILERLARLGIISPL